jgi:hypothetical protein
MKPSNIGRFRSLQFCTLFESVRYLEVFVKVGITARIYKNKKN